MSRHVDFQGLFLKFRETKSHKHSFVFRPVFEGIRPFKIAQGGPLSDRTNDVQFGREAYLPPPHALSAIEAKIEFDLPLSAIKKARVQFCSTLKTNSAHARKGFCFQ